MRIGIDFDNTIVSYDQVFHKIAKELGHITDEVGQSKEAVRDQMRLLGKEAQWIELQGLVYGSRISEANIFDGFVEFVGFFRARGDELFIISHKTKHPFAGPKYDLHEAAENFLSSHRISGHETNQILPSNIYFELTKELKVERISKCEVDIFIDDLPEIFNMQTFPPDVKKILFSPMTAREDHGGMKAATSWKEIKEYLTNEES